MYFLLKHFFKPSLTNTAPYEVLTLKYTGTEEEKNTTLPI